MENGLNFSPLCTAWRCYYKNTNGKSHRNRWSKCNDRKGRTVYPKKYAHGFVVLCFVVVMQSFIMNSHEVFIHIHQGCFAGTGAIVRLPQCQGSKPDGYGKISLCITTTKHNKAKTVCIFLGIYCNCRCIYSHTSDQSNNRVTVVLRWAVGICLSKRGFHFRFILRSILYVSTDNTNQWFWKIIKRNKTFYLIMFSVSSAAVTPVKYEFITQ